jgi:molybdate transport system regulatory protein
MKVSARNVFKGTVSQVVDGAVNAWVMLMTESSDIRLSARNCLEGNVISVTDGAVNAEVVIELAGGAKVYSIVTRDAVTELGLKPGVSATAVIKASHIILGVPA